MLLMKIKGIEQSFQSVLYKYRQRKHNRHIKKFGSKNIGHFNYFNASWFNKNQKALLFLSNNFILKYWFRWVLRIHKDLSFKESIYKIEPHYYVVNIGLNEYRADFRTHDKFSKRIYYAFRPIWHTFHVLDYFLDAYLPKLSFGFSTLDFFPEAGTSGSTCDAEVYKSTTNVSFATHRDASAGTNAGASSGTGGIQLACGTDTDMFNLLARLFFTISTSSLTSSAVISSASFSLKPNYKVESLGNVATHIADNTQTNNNSIATGDFSKIGRTSYGNFTSYTVDAYSTASFNATGISAISLTGITKLSAQLAWDIDNSFSGTWHSNWSTAYTMYLADTSGTGSDPKLSVTYTLVLPTGNQMIL